VLRIRLLGELEVSDGGTSLLPPASRRAWALLGWLALHPGAHPRGELAARFWPDVLDSSARASLRSAVWALRRALGSEAEALDATRDRVGLCAAAVDVDLARFRALVDAGRLEDAVALHAGPLLHGVDEDWALDARDEHARRLDEVLARLAAGAREGGEDAAAVAWARRRAALDGFDEAAGRDLMETLAHAGDRAGALEAYDRLAERLRRELGLAAAPETRALAARIRAASGTADRRPARRVGGDAVALQGREPELAALRRLAARAVGGRGGLAVLTGEAGIGKSRLAAEAADLMAADGALVATGAASELAASAPFAPWSELLRELGAQLTPPATVPPWAAELGRLVPSLPARLGAPGDVAPVAAAPELERARLFEAVVDLVEHVAAAAPLVLVLEDVHAADAPSLELAAHVARRTGRLAVLTILTRRPFPRSDAIDALRAALPDRGVETLELELAPLRHADMTRLVRAAAALDDHATARVVALADGNPLLGIESARAHGEHAGEPPATLRLLVRGAAARLSDPARRVLELAALAGRDLAPGELDALGAADAASAALESGLLATRGGRLGIRHALLRAAVADDVPDTRRAALHLALADAIEGPAAERARHLRAAGRDRLAVAELARAADEAWRVSALGEAAAALREALELAPRDVGLLRRLAETEAWRGRREAADEAFATALAHHDRSDAAGLADAWLERALWCRGSLCDPRACREAARRSLELLDALAPSPAGRRASAMATLAWAEAVAGDLGEAERLLAAVGALDGRAGGWRLRHEVALARGHVLAARGDLAGAGDAFEDAGAAVRARWRPDLAYTAWINAACAAAAVGDFDRALRVVEHCLLEVRGIGPLEVQALSAYAFILARVGRSAAATEAADHARAVAADVGDPALVLTAEHDSGLVALATGDAEQAERRLATALADGAPVSEAQALLARAEALVALGRLDEAQDALRATALAPVGRADFPHVLVTRLTHVQGLLAAAGGDRELARRRLLQSATGWRRLVAEGEASVVTGWSATLVDFGRVPVAGLVEPARELGRVEADLRALTAPDP
jgi:DNA-binding SARP family transcriptional activator